MIWIIEPCWMKHSSSLGSANQYLKTAPIGDIFFFLSAYILPELCFCRHQRYNTADTKLCSFTPIIIVNCPQDGVLLSLLVKNLAVSQ